MIIVEALKNIILAPLELVFEIIFSIALKITHSEGLAIIVLSLVVSTLVLPLYKRAEMIESEEREKQKELSRWVTHIKKHFKGDDKYMTLAAYYREKNYNPIFQLRSSVSILLQIPFFTAAYDFLGVRASESLSGVGFFLFDDLGRPDKILAIGNVTINVLPVVMTLVNVLACIIYTKDLPFKTAIRSYLLAAVFLVLLYNCPSALLLYWTMNNVYSLIKTIIMKNTKPGHSSRKIADTKDNVKLKTNLLSKATGFLSGKDTGNSIFFLSTVFMSVLTGLLIPLSYLGASPEEFISITDPQNPLRYLISSFFTAFGFFVFWPGVFYFLANRKTKAAFAILMFSVSVFSVVDYLVYGNDTGRINTSLVFDKDPVYPLYKVIINIFVIAAVFVVCYFVYRFKKALVLVFAASILTVLTLSYTNARKIQKTFDYAAENLDAFQRETAPRIELSSEGENVMVIMLDTAISGFIPYAFNEFPELKEQYDGFVYYPNTMSFGQNTLVTTSALFGGYEYTPERMDARVNETLADKHDEALKVMPKVFSEKGYSVTAMDLPFPGWSWNGNYSSFNEIDNFSSYYAKDYYNSDTELNVNNEARRNRNLFLYSIFRCAPLCLQATIYDGGKYLSVRKDVYDKYDVLENYKVLENLDDMTRLSNEHSGYLFLMNNETTHDTCNLRDFNPYTPCEFEGGYYVSDGTNDLYIWHKYQAGYYECMIATLKELGNYFDYLRGLGVYDNTRIILVSDHATQVKLFENLRSKQFNAEWYNCLLMVKDIDSTGFTTDDTFMTNADVPTIAFKGIVSSPVNPYTGKPIDSRQKNGALYVNYSTASAIEYLWNPEYNNGNAFDYGDRGRWLKLVNRNIFDQDNWIPVDEPVIESE